MTDVVALNANEHRNAGWQAAKSFDFAKTQSLAPVIAEEIAHVLPTMPVGFVQTRGGKASAQWMMVAVLSDQTDKNLYLHPDGRWLGGYVPACFRAYPFKLVTDQRGQKAVGFDKDSELWLDEAITPEQAFFDSSGDLNERTRKVADFLGLYEKNRLITQQAVASLVDADLFIPWVVSRSGDKTPGALHPGLHRIDEKALQALSGDKLQSLARSGALSLAYAQILSQHRLSAFTKLQRLHDEIARQREPVNIDEVDLDELFGEDDDTFKFD